MQQLEELVSAIRQKLSKEDRRLLRAVYTPCDEAVYDQMFDRVLDRLKSELDPAVGERRGA